MQIEKLTEGEEITMKAVWDCMKEPVLSDVVDRVNGFYGKDWMPQTVSTFLSKLCRKNYLKLQRNGKIYTYKTLVPEAVYRRKLYKQHISFWHNNSVVDFVIDMLRNRDLTVEDIEKAMADNKTFI